MDLATLRTVLMWCTVTNYIILMVWFFVFLSMRKTIYSWWRTMFRMTDEQFEISLFAMFGFYKLGVFLLNLVPFLVLQFAI